jgi:hypothetical protein
MDQPNQQEPAPGSPPKQYEFTSRQNAVIGPLARDMRWVAVPLELVGFLYGIALVLTAVKAFREPQLFLEAALIGLAMLFYLALGVWTGRAANSFQGIVATQGRDIAHLMDALDSLRKLYGLLSIIVKVYVAFAVVAVLVGVISVLVMAFRG